MAKVTEEWVGKQETIDRPDPIWWRLDGDDVAKNLFAVVKSVEQRQVYRRVKNIRHARLYANLDALGFQSSMYLRSQSDILSPSRVSLNVIRSCIDTSASKVAKMKPRPYFLTSNGDWSQELRAKKLTSYFEGVFQQKIPIYAEKQRSFVDSGVFGTGATKFFWRDGGLACERVLIDELIVDDSEAIYGRPIQLHQIRYVNRLVLKEMFPDREAEISQVAASGTDLPQSPSALDMLKVIETWKLPSRKGANDGRHVICIEDATLQSRNWKHDYFPFVFDRWNWNLTGFFGMGIAEEITGIQLELNKLLRSIQMAQHFACVPRVYLENASNVNTAHLNTTFGSVVKFTGSAPIFNTAPAMPPEVYAHVESLYRKAFEITGISQLSAQSVKPAGLNSGKAIREFVDNESERFQLTGQRFEESYLDATNICMDLIEENGGKLEVSGKSGKDQEMLDWEQVKMDRKDFVLRVFPASIFPSQPAAKMQSIQEYTQAGFIEKDLALSLMEFPDLEAAMSMKTAATDVVKRQIMLMLEKGIPQVPEPYQDVLLAKKLAQWTYLKEKARGAPENRLELLRNFVNDCTAIEQASQEQANPAAPAPALAKPATPPVSDLMPMAPGAA